MRSVELFSGCGGLALGLARAGFEHLSLVERDRHSVTNIEHNARLGIEHVGHWKVHAGDVREIAWSDYRDRAGLVAGGPPCQPFSIGGLHRGQEDERDMWPEAVRAVREISPQGFLFENVRGLLRPKFSEHLEWIRLSLTEPWLTLEPGEDRASHLERLRAHEDEGTYHVAVVKVNAADYGAAQKRHRVLFVGVRRDLANKVPLPEPTHSRGILAVGPVRHGSLLEAARDEGSEGRTCERHRRQDRGGAEAFRRGTRAAAVATVRDAIHDLGEPDAGATSRTTCSSPARAAILATQAARSTSLPRR